MKVRMRIDCVLELPRIPLLNGPDVLDLVADGVKTISATEILPGTRIEFKRVAERTKKPRQRKTK
jgi:hypothetical protein